MYKINIVWMERILCFITFLIVIMFIDNNFVLYAMLVWSIVYIMIYSINKLWFMLFNVGCLIYGIITGNYLFLRLILVIDYAYYFFSNHYSFNKKKDDSYAKIAKANNNRLMKYIKKGDIDKKDLDEIKNSMKDKNDADYQIRKENDFIRFRNKSNSILYITVHLSILFLLIVLSNALFN